MRGRRFITMTKLPFAFALILASTGPLVAQPRQPPPPESGQSVDELHDALRLRPDQERAWQVFDEASRPDPQEEARQRNAFERMGSLRAPQRFDLSIQMMRSDLEATERRANALRAFYATLSPEQQAIFDRETLPPRQ
jgi:Spy/CpxP family protein refolding chaperone